MSRGMSLSLLMKDQSKRRDISQLVGTTWKGTLDFDVFRWLFLSYECRPISSTKDLDDSKSEYGDTN